MREVGAYPRQHVDERREKTTHQHRRPDYEQGRCAVHEGEAVQRRTPRQRRHDRGVCPATDKSQRRIAHRHDLREFKKQEPAIDTNRRYDGFPMLASGDGLIAERQMMH